MPIKEASHPERCAVFLGAFFSKIRELVVGFLLGSE